jgi:hypothetical protein
MGPRRHSHQMDTAMTDMIKIVVKIPLSRYNEIKDHVDRSGTTMSAFARIAMNEKLTMDGPQATRES